MKVTTKIETIEKTELGTIPNNVLNDKTTFSDIFEFFDNFDSSVKNTNTVTVTKTIKKVVVNESSKSFLNKIILFILIIVGIILCLQ